jgi:hypothetical protein
MDNFDLNKYLYNNPLLNEVKINDPTRFKKYKQMVIDYFKFSMKEDPLNKEAFEDIIENVKYGESEQEIEKIVYRDFFFGEDEEGLADWKEEIETDLANREQAQNNLKEEKPLDNKQEPGEGSQGTSHEDDPLNLNNFENEIDHFVKGLREILEESKDHDEAWSNLHNLIYESFPPDSHYFNLMWNAAKEDYDFIKWGDRLKEKFDLDINSELDSISNKLDDLNENLKSKIKKIVKEMSMIGGGEAYNTKFAFKKVKKK